MSELIITADLHGSYSSWLAIKSILKKEDGLAVAGDLFDNKYGSFSNQNWDPDGIKTDLKSFAHPFFFVYGNCDIPSFLPGFSTETIFDFNGKTICMCHGHFNPSCIDHSDIIIVGHTHLAGLEKNGNQILLNPGTITAPRNHLFTYAVMNENSIYIVNFKTGEKMRTIKF